MGDSLTTAFNLLALIKINKKEKQSWQKHTGQRAVSVKDVEQVADLARAVCGRAPKTEPALDRSLELAFAGNNTHNPITAINNQNDRQTTTGRK